MTQEERKFAEQRHDLVIDFLCRKRLSMDDFYDVVIFGYLSAVQQYFRNPPAGVAFKAMAFRAMKDSGIVSTTPVPNAAVMLRVWLEWISKTLDRIPSGRLRARPFWNRWQRWLRQGKLKSSGFWWMGLRFVRLRSF